MPKYLVTNGSYFQPFTYDELAKPIMQAVEAHNAAQDAYDSLTMDTEALRQYLATEPENSTARSMYNSYTEKLANLQNNLWERGYNAGTRRDLAAARAGYASDITRLATAISERKEKSKAHQEMKLKDPDLVASDDPIHESLDRYLDNTAGQGYFAYSGKQFEAGVATEIQAKAQALRSSGVVKDPELINQLTRIINYGVTEADRQAASPIVDLLLNESKDTRDQYYKDHGTSVAEQLLVETLINRYDAVGARGAKLSDTERSRLINYGKAGWAHGSFKPETKDFTDPEYEEQADIRKMQRQLQMNKDLEDYKYKLQHPELDSNAPYTFGSVLDSYDVTGENHDKRLKELEKMIGDDGTTMFTSKDGHKVTNHINASSLVYSEGLRRQMYPILGFDIGRDKDRGILGIDKLTPSSRYLEGKITRGNKEYYTRLYPKDVYTDPETGKDLKGVVKVWTDEDQTPRAELNLTSAYHKARKIYDDNLNNYRENEKDIYKLATIDPDKQYKYYTDDDIDFGSVSLEDYKSAVMAKPENAIKRANDLYIAEIGTDSGNYIGRMAGKLQQNFTVTGDSKSGYTGSFSYNGVDYNGRAFDKNTFGFHYVDKYGNISQDAVRNLNDIFDFNSKHEITNITAIYNSADSVKAGCVVIKTTKSKNPVTVPIEYFHDEILTRNFYNYQNIINEIEEDPTASRQAKMYATLVNIDKLNKLMRSTIGYVENLQSEGATNKEDTN